MDALARHAGRADHGERRHRRHRRTGARDLAAARSGLRRTRGRPAAGQHGSRPAGRPPHWARTSPRSGGCWPATPPRCAAIQARLDALRADAAALVTGVGDEPTADRPSAATPCSRGQRGVAASTTPAPLRQRDHRAVRRHHLPADNGDGRLDSASTAARRQRSTPRAARAGCPGARRRPRPRRTTALVLHDRAHAAGRGRAGARRRRGRRRGERALVRRRGRLHERRAVRGGDDADRRLGGDRRQVRGEGLQGGAHPGRRTDVRSRHAADGAEGGDEAAVRRTRGSIGQRFEWIDQATGKKVRYEAHGGDPALATTERRAGRSTGSGSATTTWTARARRTARTR